MSFSLDLKKIAAKFDIKVDDTPSWLKELILELRKIASSYNIEVKEHADSPETVDDVRAYKCMKQMLLHGDIDSIKGLPDRIELDSFCCEFDNKIDKLLSDIEDLEMLKEASNKLQKEFDSEQKCQLESKAQYDDFYKKVLSPYEKLKEELDKATKDYNDEVARLVSLEEKYQNRAQLVDLNHLKESLEEERSKMDKDIEEAKIKIHEYQRLNPDLLDEYKSLKNELEMLSLLEQINTSSASDELTASSK